MTRSAYLLVAFALALSAALTAYGEALPREAWALVGLMLGGAVKRPEDTSPAELARELEQHDPTMPA